MSATTTVATTVPTGGGSRPAAAAAAAKLPPLSGESPEDKIRNGVGRLVLEMPTDLWDSLAVKILTGKSRDCTGVVAKCGNGWVQVHILESTPQYKQGKRSLAKRSNELQVYVRSWQRVNLERIATRLFSVLLCLSDCCIALACAVPRYLLHSHLTCLLYTSPSPRDRG